MEKVQILEYESVTAEMSPPEESILGRGRLGLGISNPNNKISHSNCLLSKSNDDTVRKFREKV